MSFRFEVVAGGRSTRRPPRGPPHGEVDTPVFMPVGTRGTVKALDAGLRSRMGTRSIILGNTYHLNIRPGWIIAAAGGLHRFMNWPKPILTDSGGFQVFSLAQIRKIKAHGVEFRSHLDGSLLFLGPKESMDIQRTLGVGHRHGVRRLPAAPRAARATSRPPWSARCAGRGNAATNRARRPEGVRHRAGRQRRRHCARSAAGAIAELGFDGYAIGGVSVGETGTGDDAGRRADRTASARRSAALRDGLGTPAQWSSGSRAAWTCSTASCRRGRRATASVHALRSGKHPQRPPHRRSAPLG